MPEEKRAPISVLGAGSWGTALAIQFARTGHDVLLWARDSAQAAGMAANGENERYLPGAPFPPSLTVDGDLGHAVNGADDLLIVVPSHAFRALLQQIEPLARPALRLAWATKGFELESGKLPHQVALEVLGPGFPMAVLSGPTFAREVGAGLPTAMTIASTNHEFCTSLANSLSGDNFRAYTSDDIVGVETGGAVKNVLAIGAGISDGLGFGANTRVALITRGLVEMTRLGMALGAGRETFMGLAGIGDLVLTCTDDQSRNRQMGLKLAAGIDRDRALAQIGQVVEGITAARAVWRVARRLGVEMPITEQVYRILYEGVDAGEAVRALMSRTLKSEAAY